MITFEKLEREVRKLAEKNPEFIYLGETDFRSGLNRCFYKPTKSQPGCIFGQALLRLQVDPEDIPENEGIAVVLSRLGIPATDEQALWASFVQKWQDMGISWGVAVHDADGSEGP